jgi:DNA-binding HxlR family transcriptional regulator
MGAPRPFAIVTKSPRAVSTAQLFVQRTVGVLAEAVSGISESVLDERLSELMSAGLIERQLTDGPVPAVLYRLTPAGEDFRAALNELRDERDGGPP